MYPVEMTHYKSWIVWKLVKIDGRKKPAKMPYSPITGKAADSTNPDDWTTHAHAVAYLREHPQYDGLGFVFSAADPFVGIDIDAPENEAQRAQSQRILQAFEPLTYIERSPSTTGYHVILRGQIENNRRREPIEMYSTERYFTMTGDTVADNMVGEDDYLLAHLWFDLGGAKKDSTAVINDRPESKSDEDVYREGCDAANGTRFRDLFHGNYLQYYSGNGDGDHSAADFALVNMLSFYSRNAEQIRRMFLASDLGKRPKAHRGPSKNKQLGYLDEMIQKSFDNMAPEISIDQLIGNFDTLMKEEKAKLKADPEPMLGRGWQLPPGLLGEIAEFIYQQAPRPVKEIALAGAIGLMAGITGRAYNVSNTGLNHYILLLASTGTGKEAIKSGISRIIKEVKKNIPVASDFIGPAAIASGQALMKYLSKNASFVSILGEFGLTLQTLCGPMANSSQIMLRQVLLDVYNKSGIHNDLQSAVYSDKANNTDVVEAPAMTLVGETTPASYFPHLDNYMVEQGLIPRFTCIEYSGERVRFNKASATAEPSTHLINNLTVLINNSLQLQQRREAVTVEFTEEAAAYVDAFDIYCDDRCNVSDEGVAKHLWTRGHIKIMKLAALIAVGVHPYEPVITLEMAAWARNMVERDIINIISHFESGQAGSDSAETGQINQIAAVLRDYANRPFDEVLDKYGVNEEMHKQHIVTLTYLSRRLIQKNQFAKDRLGASTALRRSIDAMVNDGAIIALKESLMMDRFKSTAKAFIIADLSRFQVAKT
jgi:hypothetical protein